ncbi:RNA exonuclease 5 [Trichonephila inaurata madagascariensis]|uniref:RNA exonuclease 5 n=1 Tax=Trichonephila inaurata madagascariensis TaxID=2747483 RepID=A0A8X7C9Q8_9ARAC|nr:RNA exonuclease 5 [Trichonephila inaurata madagascariensis]
METPPYDSEDDVATNPKKRKIEEAADVEKTESTSVEKESEKKEKVLQMAVKAFFNRRSKVEPGFYLNTHGENAAVDVDDYKSGRACEPVCMDDIYQLLLKSVIGYKYKLRWATLHGTRNISKTLLLVVEGFTKSEILENTSELNMIDMFQQVVETASSNIHFATELCSLHQIADFHVRTRDTFSTMFTREQRAKIEAPSNYTSPSKLNLLLSPIQMLMENYPCPGSNYTKSRCNNYIYTKETYASATIDSPMFAINCQMCVTENRPRVLTRITVVDENLRTVFNSMVKPDCKITEYATHFSSISENVLKGGTVKLSEVQQQVQKLLPANAILIGQSLNYGLHSMRMIHPYVIDTSIIFNNTGVRKKKLSLKHLASVYLNKDIQVDGKEHDPVEDAVTMMELVQFRLKQLAQFPKDFFYNQQLSSVLQTTEDTELPASEVGPNSVKAEPCFFSLTSKFSKKCSLIGNEVSLKYYYGKILNENTEKIVKSNRRDIINTTLDQISKKDLVITHVCYNPFTQLNAYEEFNDILKRLYNAYDDRYMLMVLISGVDETNYSDIKNGLFMSAFKVPKKK